jgi:glycosyltransferase involved in cell wall biosynthesis
VAALLEEADMLVLPSFAEGVPMVLMEAMASRIPVIASRVAGVPELVEDGVTGFLVPPGDVESLAARMVALWDDPERARAMGARGRRVVEADFDVEREAEWLLRLFRSADPATEQRGGA